MSHIPERLTPRWILAILLAVIVGTAALSACGGSDDDAATPSTSAKTTDAARFDGTGPHEVGLTTYTIPKADGSPREITVWYPAAEGSAGGKPTDLFRISTLLPEQFRSLVPADLDVPLELDAHRELPADRGGPFPVYAFAHGFGAYPLEYQHLLTHVASWGFVVVAPSFDERGILSLLGAGGDTPSALDEGAVMLDAVAALSSTGGPAKGLARKGKFVVAGHSAGTGSVFQTAAEHPDQVAGMQLMSGGGFRDSSSTFPDVPALLVEGTKDGVVSPDSVAAAFEKLKKPKMLVSFEGAGHLTFTDLCVIGREQGGVLGIAEKIGLLKLVGEDGAARIRRLAGDGCGDQWVAPESAWVATDHLSVAFARWRSGIDPTPSSLSANVVKKIGKVPLGFEGSFPA